VLEAPGVSPITATSPFVVTRIICSTAATNSGLTDVLAEASTGRLHGLPPTGLVQRNPVLLQLIQQSEKDLHTSQNFLIQQILQSSLRSGQSGSVELCSKFQYAAARRGSLMFDRFLMMVICLAAEVFYLRFLVAMWREPKRLPVAYWVRLRSSCCRKRSDCAASANEYEILGCVNGKSRSSDPNERRGEFK